MFSDFPSLHPLVVHFPIVLILLAAALQGVALWKPHWVQIRWATLIILGGGFAGSLLSSTVFHAMIAPDAPKEAMAIFEEHEQYAQYTLWMSGFTLLLKSIGIIFKINRRAYEAIVFAAAIVAAIFLSIAGHHGARLTHVAGVGPMGKYLMKGHGAGGHHEKGMEDMDMKGDSTMDGHDSMPDMKNMPGMDTAKGMNNMEGMDDMKGMKDMPGMNNNSNDMKNMKGMDNMKGMKGMKDMKGMDKTKDMENMKDMKNMPGMDTMKGMNNMKDMKGMDGMKGMEGMDNMKGMPGMGNMKGMKLIDTSKPYDNNPAQEKKQARKKQE